MSSVGVVIPCLNGAQYLRECLDSVLAQDYDGQITVVVADDGSTDATEQIVAEYQDDLQLLPCPPDAQHGCGAARNRAIRILDTTYIAPIDADDIWLPGHISSLVEAMETNLNAGMACDNGHYLDEKSRMYGTIVPANFPREIDSATMLLNCFTDPTGVLIRRSLLNEVGGFAESSELLYVEDHDLWLRLLERYQGIYIASCGYGYRIHSGQVSLNPTMWRNAYNVLEHASARHPYSKQLVRKRKAVLHYRASQVALRQRRKVLGLWMLARSAMLDPWRAIIELQQRV